MGKIKEVKEILQKMDAPSIIHYADYLLEDYAFQICQLFEPKPDKSRLIGDEENPYWYVNAGCYKPNCLQMYTDREIELLRMAFRDGSEAQDAQTASIKDVECQEQYHKVICRECKTPVLVTGMIGKYVDVGCKCASGSVEYNPNNRWQALKKKESVYSMDKPTYLRAAIEDWRNELISLEKLCELWEVSLYAIYAGCGCSRLDSVDETEEILEGLK